MSYRCFICTKPVPHGVACQKRVIQKRVKHYPEREHAKREWREIKGKWKMTWTPDPGGVGFETVFEANCCTDCAAKFDKIGS